MFHYISVANGTNGWYGDQTAADPNAVAAAAPVEQQGFSIPTTGGGGPMRQGRGGGGARYVVTEVLSHFCTVFRPTEMMKSQKI